MRNFEKQWFRQILIKTSFCIEFNIGIILKSQGKRLVIVFGSRYIKKFANESLSASWYWYYSVQLKENRDLGNIDVIDIENHMLFHLKSVQPIIGDQEGTIFTYLCVNKFKKTLFSISKNPVFDTWVSKIPFFNQILEMDIQMIGSLLENTSLNYLFQARHSGKQGSSRKNESIIDFIQINKGHFKSIRKEKEVTVIPIIVYFKLLYCNIRFLYVKYKNNKSKLTCKLYSYTNTGINTIVSYKGRFQIKFLYYEGKQEIDLTNFNARSEYKLYFQFNDAFVSVNIVKVVHLLSVPQKLRKPFSLTNTKIMKTKMLQLHLFVTLLDTNEYSGIDNAHFKELKYFGIIIILFFNNVI